ncbi:hypothetical protein KTN05_11760 [Paracoccus sp. Z118]|uniref:hypothetical protein n=1 Tax=Paracoccus sp. Z118 TaxID=2851017 RepID=UPI001C2C6D06|nr:hypothetical protein [Paracoccus sp. Z118]MBV0892526.1 hypothetical protein [Paracoccus sp. Z118]
MTTRFLTIAAAALALSACAPAADTAPTEVPRTHPGQPGAAPVACAPREWGGLIGKPVDDARLPPGLTYRVIPRGAMITEEYMDARLNIITGPATGMVLDVTCG